MMTASYRDPQRTISERVEDLLARMTPAEKVGQMMQLPATVPETLDQVRAWGLGSVLSAVGVDTLPLQQAALESRLGIPLSLATDAIHGHSMQYGATIFPSQLAISCSWDEALIERMARVTAKEVSCTGIHWTFSLVFCLPRDLRWGWINETFGEAPLLIGRCGGSP